MYDYWSRDPSKRPTFLGIHIRLTSLKSAMLKGVVMNGVTNDTRGSLWKGFFIMLLLCFDHLDSIVMVCDQI